MSTTPPEPAPLTRQLLRERLLALRQGFASSPEVASACRILEKELADTVARLEPTCLGVYWPVRSEFNAAPLWQGRGTGTPLPLALPFAQRVPKSMHYRRWDGAAPALQDECGLPASDGAAVVPDVVLIPCVGFTRSGYRLGYGGGYFDRWLAAHPHVTSVGVAWAACEMSEADFAAQTHDQPLTLVVTERGVG